MVYKKGCQKKLETRARVCRDLAGKFVKAEVRAGKDAEGLAMSSQGNQRPSRIGWSGGEHPDWAAGKVKTKRTQGDLGWPTSSELEWAMYW